MIAIQSDIDPGEYFLRMHTKAPPGTHYGVLITYNKDSVEHKEYIYINGTSDWNTQEVYFEVKGANRVVIKFEDSGIKIAYPIIVNRSGYWKIVTTKNQSG